MDRIPLETMTACENSLWFSGWDSQVSTAGGPGSSLIWELRSRMPQVLAKNNKRKEKKFKRESLTAYLLQSLPGRAFFQNSSDWKLNKQQATNKPEHKYNVPGILQARILEWVAMPSSRGSSPPRGQTHVSYVSCIVGRFVITEPPRKPISTIDPLIKLF